MLNQLQTINSLPAINSLASEFHLGSHPVLCVNALSMSCTPQCAKHYPQAAGDNVRFLDIFSSPPGRSHFMSLPLPSLSNYDLLTPVAGYRLTFLLVSRLTSGKNARSSIHHRSGVNSNECCCCLLPSGDSPVIATAAQIHFIIVTRADFVT